MSTAYLNANIFATTRPPEEGSTAADENASKIVNPELNQKSFAVVKCSPVAADGAVVEVLGRRGRADVAGGRQPEMWH